MLSQLSYDPIATRMGLEPTTSAVTGRRSNQLSHRARQHLKAVPGVPSKPHTNKTHPSPFLPSRLCPRPISNSQLHVLPHFHPCPIHLVVFKGSYSLAAGISHLEGGFTLRCLQRLSLPGLATLPCSWRNSRYTSGRSIPVLSY